jgi:NAD-dependent SIR2 family protein deacetylase
MSHDVIKQAAEWIRDADGLLITAGAGMGVDSGLPDFRGPEGFWRAYPALRSQGLTFREMANPDGFEAHPRLSWGFYGHRLALYRATNPHDGFGILCRWASRKRQGAFVFTSNVDGQFQKAGFAQEQVLECHGTIHTLQCLNSCSDDTWSADSFVPAVDEQVCELTNAMPTCPHCGGLARPNILMFNDWNWVERTVEQQETRFAAWLKSSGSLTVIEIGAGLAIPTVRRISENFGPHVVRINLREPEIRLDVGIGIAGGALETLRRIDEQLPR